jgi:para-nitrobenzyl esterase
VRGHRDGDVVVFRGIPYAAPPVANRRWRPPQPPEPWRDVRDASTFGPIAPQLRGPLDAHLGTGDQPTAEDCLSVNVWTPGTDEARRPVMVWIHGGAFTTGAASTPWYDGARMASHGDVVLVSGNYRLGALGFSYLDDLGADFAGCGNLGLLDQLALLRWVQEHAERFGGDPGNVTVFGESAGGASIVALLAVAESAGLFHRAIVESASFTQLRDRGRAAQTARDFVAHLDGPPEALRNLPVDAILAAQRHLLADPLAWFTACSPVADGGLLPDSVDELLAAAARNPVPVLVGTNRDEMHLFSAFDPSYHPLDEVGLLRRVT